jgi:hypothetical protein
VLSVFCSVEAREGNSKRIWYSKKLNPINYFNNVTRAALLKKHIVLERLAVFHITRKKTTSNRRRKTKKTETKQK